jgi:hypothetical protein
MIFLEEFHFLTGHKTSPVFHENMFNFSDKIVPGGSMGVLLTVLYLGSIWFCSFPYLSQCLAGVKDDSQFTSPI